MIPGRNLPRRVPDGYLKLKEGVRVVRSEGGGASYVVRALEGYCTTSEAYNRTNARWHQDMSTFGVEVLKARSKHRRWKTRNRLLRNQFLK